MSFWYRGNIGDIRTELRAPLNILAKSIMLLLQTVIEAVTAAEDIDTEDNNSRSVYQFRALSWY